jgi:hypothetical protein
MFIGDQCLTTTPLLFADVWSARRRFGLLVVPDNWEIVAVSLTFTPLDKPGGEADHASEQGKPS